jgi:hypothetical protein
MSAPEEVKPIPPLARGYPRITREDIDASKMKCITDMKKRKYTELCDTLCDQTHFCYQTLTILVNLIPKRIYSDNKCI